jgi:peptidoglycan/LPS O-acetylase OafA/YrhL
MFTWPFMKERLGCFDELRGIAALIVVLHHFDYAFRFVELLTSLFFKTALLDFPLNLLHNGRLAVYVFFMMSGYVLSYPFFRKGNLGFLSSSATKRYFRLGIPVFGSVMLSYFLLEWGLYKNVEVGKLIDCSWLSGFWDKGASFWDAVYISIFVNQGYYNAPVLWTISVEFYGSMMVFAFLSLFGKLKNRRWLYIPLFFLLAKTFYVAFLIGLALCDFTHLGIHSKSQKIKMGLLIFLCGGSLFLPLSWKLMIHSINDMEIIYAVMIISLVLISENLKKILETRIPAFFGAISFSMYLLHPLVLGSFSCTVFLFFWKQQVDPTANFFYTLLTSMPLLIDISYLFYLFVDSNGVKTSNFIYSCLFKKEEVISPEK